MHWCGELASTLLLHANLLLAVLAGGALLTSARMCWDPELYVPARELFPLEYRAAAILLPVLALVPILAAHLALLAVSSRSLVRRRVLLYVYAVLMAAVSAFETALGVWAWARGVQWVGGDAAQGMRRAAALAERVEPLLDELARWPELPQLARVAALLREARTDLPRQLHVLLAGAVLALALQLLGALLAAIAAATTPRRAYSTLTLSTPLSARKSDARRPRAVYRQGRLQLLPGQGAQSALLLHRTIGYP